MSMGERYLSERDAAPNGVQQWVTRREEASSVRTLLTIDACVDELRDLVNAWLRLAVTTVSVTSSLGFDSFLGWLGGRAGVSLRVKMLRSVEMVEGRRGRYKSAIRVAQGV